MEHRGSTVGDRGIKLYVIDVSDVPPEITVGTEYSRWRVIGSFAIGRRGVMEILLIVMVPPQGDTVKSAAASKGIRNRIFIILFFSRKG